jgi:hypothetical protein
MENPSLPPFDPAYPAPLPPVNAYDAVAWPEPSVHEARVPAYVGGRPEDASLTGVPSALPDWLVIGAGGLVAAILGALVGGALHI